MLLVHCDLLRGKTGSSTYSRYTRTFTRLIAWKAKDNGARLHIPFLLQRKIMYTEIAVRRIAPFIICVLSVNLKLYARVSIIKRRHNSFYEVA